MNEKRGAAENGRMRNKQEIRRIVEGFSASGKTRRAYSEEHGISITTLDYWRRKHNNRKPKLIEVAMIDPDTLTKDNFHAVVRHVMYVDLARMVVTASLSSVMASAAYYYLRREKEGTSAGELARVFE